ncbi:F-box protein SKIP22-like [Typha latifolia]|uniref:F-box protein SKIP22-like n=1 Tax=Typha latifolia TaxID=4733 RepID=UPI003C2B8107
MKLRIRSLAAKETIRIDAPGSSSLLDLKTLLAGHLSSAAPVPPESIHLSLNRDDELFSSSPDDPISSLGLTSGDLLFYSVSSEPQTVAVTKNLDPAPSRELLPDQEGKDRMEVDAKPTVVENSPLISLLKKAMEVEGGRAMGILEHFVIAIHAAFLDSGFFVVGGDGSRLPQGWAPEASTFSLRYTLDQVDGEMFDLDAKVAVLKFSVMGQYIMVYGYLAGGSSDSYRVCLDALKLVSLGTLNTDSVSDKEDKEIFELWKVMKDGLCLPLQIDICLKNKLPLPPCFMRLSDDIKTKILSSLPGVNVVKVGATCSELRQLCSDDNLWKQKFEEEFGSTDRMTIAGRNWKERFARAWKEETTCKRSCLGTTRRFGFVSRPSLPLFPDFDLSPPAHRVVLPRLPSRQQFPSPYNRLNSGGPFGGML